jgi:mono/diheme cytochrome c family protein
MRWVTVFLLAPLTAAAAGEPADFFELRVRPVLARYCHACHTRSKLGGLEITSREALLQGGKRGAAILPGNPTESLLIRAVRKNGDVKMPPQGRLTDREIEDLELWIKAGAPWPETPGAASAQTTGEYAITAEQRAFWSFQPIRRPAPPAVRNSAWPRTAMDRFVLAKLEEKGLRPVEPADRRTWLRRVTLDLTGLPPTPEEALAFERDSAPDARARVVERLLSSPRYGERWGRFWLDVMRYANDTMYGKPPAFDRYRDWVIQAFNDDLPMDVFLKAHLAGDLLPDAGRDLRPALTPFVDTSSEFADDDRVDLVGRGFLGLTLQCAQCHDHKYDPVPTQDFYSLMGVFRSTRPREIPLAPAPVVEEHRRLRQAADEADQAVKEFVSAETARLMRNLAENTAAYLLAARGAGPAEGLDPETLARWRRYLRQPVKPHPFFRTYESLPERDGAALRVEALRLEKLILEVLAEKGRVDEYNRMLTAGVEVQRMLGEVEGRTMARDRYMLWQDLCARGNPQAALSGPDARVDGVLYYRPEQLSRFLPPAARRQLAALQARAAELKQRVPPPYPYLSAIEDVPTPVNLRVHVRGSAENLGPEAPRRFLRILSDGEPAPFRQGSGRLELAEAIASPRNPLTARVLVNRVWEWRFGKGLVRTPGNFGQTGERPTHPELLDYLAGRLIDQGWSLKRLHREMLLSSVYALSAARSAAEDASDPDNRLLWRFARRRLDVEALRDSMLAVSGTLDPAAGGAPLPLDAANRRRTVYAFISRQRLDPLLAAFDFPNPNLTSEQRVPTTVPTQRLFLLNGEFMDRQAQALSSRAKTETDGSAEARLRRLYALAYQRAPEPAEVARGLRFTAAGEEAWAHFAQVLLAANEFLYIE